MSIARQLDVAFSTALKTELQTYLRSLDTDTTFSLSGTSHSFLFERFKKARKIESFPLPRSRTNYGIASR